MWIKPAIIVLLILLLISLFSGFVFLMKDQGTTKRTFYALGIRVSLAIALVGLIAWGFYTGQLRSNAPWDAALEAKRQQQQTPPASPP